VEHFVSLPDIFSITASVSYLFAAFIVITTLFTDKGPNIVLVLFLGCIGIITHSISSNQLLFPTEVINFSLPNVISLVSLIITLTVSATALKYKVNLLLPVVYSFAAFWQLVLFLIPNGDKNQIISEQLGVMCHVSISLIAYCILVIATLYAFQVSYINYKLKNKNIQAVSHLPPLMQVEGQLFILLAMGTLSLSLSLIVGFVFLDNLFSSQNSHKITLSFMSLIVYLVILWGHFKQGWRGHKVLILTNIATFLLTLAYFGSRFVKEFILQ
jgi:ABC-type uncharacterized transport system permease subunit